MIHLALLALAVFFVWETARAVLPVALPGAVNALLLLGIAYGLGTYVPDRYLTYGAVVSIVGVLAQKWGSNVEPRTFRLPSSRRTGDMLAGRIPPLP